MNKFFILTTGFLVLLVIISVLFLGLNQVKPIQSPTPVVYPTPPYQSPVSFPSPLPTFTQKGELNVIKVEPAEDLSKNYNPVTEIKFTFNDDIDLENFLLEISPNTQVSILPDTKTHSYTISPKKFWPAGITTINIHRGTRSLKDYELNNTFTYKINVQSPENPPPDANL